MKQVYLERYQEGGYNLYRIPSIICTNRGVLIACYECRYGGDWSAMDLAIRRSTDGGDTWSERRILVSGNEIDAIHNPILFADGDMVHLLWHRNYRELFYMRSMDDGATWSKPRDISEPYLNLRSQYNWTVIDAGPGHGTVTSSGRLIIPVWVAKNRQDINSHHPSVVTTLYSDDRGETWKCGEIIWNSDDFIDPNESVLAELSDGRIMINCRHETRTGMRKIGFSPDGISGWSDFYFDPQLPDPICAAGMTYGNGHIWFTNCAHTSQRNNLTLRRSDDDGKTWPYSLLLDEDGGYSDVFYSSSQNMLYVLAETGRAVKDQGWTFGISVIIVSPDEIAG